MDLNFGELLMVLFIFGLIWSSRVLPRLGERLGERLLVGREPRQRGG